MFDVDKLLYRKIKSGAAYEKLIPKFENVVHHFDKKTDNSDTYDTLEYMAQWCKKYSYQMLKIAPLLKGKTVEETCNNVYQFLYWHFQYKLDGEAQDLYSPSAAWHYRQKGFDCKTFSLLGAMILNNLGIDCSFRMVQQSSPFWSHVYVIVPNGSKYYVIDATTHDNKEVRFSKKYDKNMHHRGLANPLASRLGCSCSGKQIRKTGLGNPGTMAQSVANFHLFLNELERKGVSRNCTDQILEIVKQNIQNGIDPIMSEVIQMAAGSRLGSGIGDAAYTQLTGSNGPSINGINAGTAASAYMGDPQAIMSVVTAIIPKNFIGNTFGAVFSNGLDLSCWGASLTPAKAAEDIKDYHLPHFNYRLTAISNAGNNLATTEAAVNAFIKDVYILEKYYKVYKPVSANWSGCAKKGIKAYQDFMSALKIKADILVSDFESKGGVSRIEKLMPLDFWFRQTITGKPDKDQIRNEAATAFVDFPQLNLTAVRNSDPSQPNVIDNGNGTITTINPITGQSVTTPKPTTPGSPKKSSSMALPILGGTALAFFLFTPKTDVSKGATKAKSTTKK